LIDLNIVIDYFLILQFFVFIDNFS